MIASFVGILSDGKRRLARSPARRSAFTLVELLVTIAIIGILAGLLLGVAAVAAESGREAKTKQMISRLHTLVMEHYESFRDRRVELANPANASGIQLAQLRLLGAREQMKMEMPDRWSDFLTYDLNNGLPNPNSNPASGGYGQPAFLASVPTLAQVYRRQFEQLIANNPPTADDLVLNEGAECLYMIVMFATGDGESRGLFKDSDIGDTDGDGAPEFLDGWGNPVQFLRWAPGYESDLQLSFGRLSEIEEEAEDNTEDGLTGREAVVKAVNKDADPFDLFRLDRPFDQNNAFAQVPSPEDSVRGFRLMPLIYSGGRDEDNDIATGRLNRSLVTAFEHDPDDKIASVDPYIDLGGVFVGGPNADDDGQNWVDNITNHLIEIK